MKKPGIVITTSLPVFAVSLGLAACGGSSPQPQSGYAQTTSATPDDVGSTAPRETTTASSRDLYKDRTPVDPGLPSFERRTTAEIQRRLLTDDALSATAKNVEVVTVGRKVTLRGDVHNENEKTIIERHARESVGITEIDDQLRIVK